MNKNWNEFFMLDVIWRKPKELKHIKQKFAFHCLNIEITTKL